MGFLSFFTNRKKLPKWKQRQLDRKISTSSEEVLQEKSSCQNNDVITSPDKPTIPVPTPIGKRVPNKREEIDYVSGEDKYGIKIIPIKFKIPENVTVTRSRLWYE